MGKAYKEKIKHISALQILDSRGVPTLRVRVETSEGHVGVASVPSGASTGEQEALELRDKDPSNYFGKSVQKALKHIEGPIQERLRSFSIEEQEQIDLAMCELDGTPNKSKLGANAILGVSLAVAVAAAKARGLPLFASLCPRKKYILPCPMMNLINGGVHADNLLDFQEFMIRPKKASSFHHALRKGSEIFHTLKKLLQEKGFSTTVGDEGGFAPALPSTEQALDFLLSAIEKAGYLPQKEISLALDVAASELYEQGHYIEKKKQKQKASFKTRSSKEQVQYLQQLAHHYPMDSIEDGMDQNDWEGWYLLTQKMGQQIQLVGDDLFVTNPSFLQKGIENRCANAILIKVNQIGTLTQTLQTIKLAQEHGYQTIISHRSGETEDTFIADLAVATHAGQIKTGSLSRSERLAKYNRLLEIEKLLGEQGTYQDSNPYTK